MTSSGRPFTISSSFSDINEVTYFVSLVSFLLRGFNWVMSLGNGGYDATSLKDCAVEYLRIKIQINYEITKKAVLGPAFAGFFLNVL